MRVIRLCCVAVLGIPGALRAQTGAALERGGRAADSTPAPLLPLTRAAAIDSALRHGARAALARADSLVARASLLTARALPNPTANLTYTRDLPHYHGILSVPFDYPWTRSARVRSARLGLRSASYRSAFERAAIRFDVDTAYTHALAADDRGRLSHRNAVDADSLRQLAVVRRDAGDASDMDVDLATVNAGQQANAATADSLAAITSRLDLQTLVGLPADRVVVALVDSLTEPDSAALFRNVSSDAGVPSPSPANAPSRAIGRVDAAPAAAGAPPPAVVPAPPPLASAAPAPLPVAAAQATLEAQQAALAAAHRGVLAQPAFQAGVEGGDPGQPFPLPTFGLSIPFPLFNRNGGEIALATANRDRALAELELVRRESATQRSAAARDLHVSLARIRRDRTLLAAANRVAARALASFAEGATALPSVLESQRSVRDALGQYINDLAAANTAAAALRLVTLTAPPQ